MLDDFPRFGIILGSNPGHKSARMLVIESPIRHIKGKTCATLGICADYAAKWRVGKTPSLPQDAAA